MYEFLIVLILATLGLVVGSFLSCVTYRIPRGISFIKGRSFCPNCKHPLVWYDNIPVLSYLLLKGRCRYCKAGISIRYPLLEILTAVVFAAFYISFKNCSGAPICNWADLFGILYLPFSLVIATLVLAIFIIDLETKLIPDELVFAGFALSFLAFFISSEDLYSRMFVAFAAGAALLALHLITRGRGMGLGDVKFALFGGFLLDPKAAIYWVFLSFVIGAVVSVYLLITKKAKFGMEIPFGPFLATSLILTILFGEKFSFLFVRLI